MDTLLSVQFLGGVASGDNLTGSAILLIIEQEKRVIRILIDAGLVQTNFKEFFEKNREILQQLKPERLDAIVLTHSHLDHIGRLPFLVRNGFGKQGRVICTEATAGLLRVMLEDSAKIQAIESSHLKAKLAKEGGQPDLHGRGRDHFTRGNYDRLKNFNKNKKRSSNGTTEPLYDMNDVEIACNLVKNGGSPYHSWIRLAKGINLKFYASGHVLGGAIAVIRVETKNGDIHLGFSGDLGRRDGIILPPPEIVEEPLDYWFSESTYGGKFHPERQTEIDDLLKVVRKAADKKQKIIIPSFALERTQEIVYLLSYYMSVRKIPRMNMYLDAPMATRITKVFSQNWDLQMFSGQDIINFNPFSTEENHFLKTVNDKKSSLELLKEPGPYIVIAGSGMCDAGRVRDHLRAGLSHKQTVVCLVGYMAKNSLGRKLKEGFPIVKMNGDEIIIKAEIVNFESFSAHADSSFLVSYTENIAAPGKLKKIFLVHGEEESATYLKSELLKVLPDENKWLKNILIPKLGQEVKLL